MKKLLILALALVMALTVSFGVFAEEIIGGNTGANALSDPANIDVTVGVNTLTASTVYRVDIAWDNVAFTYTPAYDNDWDPNALTYNEEVPAAWSGTVANITVTNRSNADVKASAVATAGDDIGVSYTFTGDGSLTTLGRADTIDGVDVSKLNKVVYTFTIDENDAPSNAGTIATIDITLQ